MTISDHWQTIPDVVQAARAAMPAPLWQFSGSGPESEISLRRNRAAYDRLALLPRLLRDVSSRDLSTTMLGHRLTMPVMLAPIGLIQLFHPDGAVAQARVADRVGTITFIGTNSEPALEEVRAACRGPIVFQLYTYGDRDWIRRLAQRVENAGYDAICLTVDCPDAGLRDRYLQNDFENRARGGQRPNVEPMPKVGNRSEQNDYLGRFTWDELAWLRENTRLPLILKGILSQHDAKLAVDHGANVIHVSNHGGRRQDQLPATLDVLPSIVKAVDNRAEIIFDGGIMRGTDVVKALALGAQSVLIGKLMMWALSAGGDEGLCRALDILSREIGATMANVGAATTSDLTPDMVIPSFDPPLTPWPVEPMSLREA
jgi:isopentenyl diphosphate isomerase/L-lactate dehydrogenase-like FMN-dependent dehydrogenase